MKLWRAANRDHIKQYKAEYNATEKAYKQRQSYRRKYRAKLTLKRKTWLKQNPHKKSEYEHKYRSTHSRHISDYMRKWKSNHPEFVERTNLKARQKRWQMDDGYIAERMGLPKEIIPKPLLETKRAHLKLKRQLKQAICQNQNHMTPDTIESINIFKRHLSPMVWRNLHKQIGMPYNNALQVMTLALNSEAFRWLKRNDHRYCAPHEQRMINEHAELRGRREKLLAFIRENPEFVKLPHEEQTLMIEQQNHMSRYEEVLARRITRFL